jgi:uncharacterized delta-60 repeat protein
MNVKAGIQIAFCLLGLCGVLHADAGDLDTTFDVDGRVTTDFQGNQDRVHAIVIQPMNGKIIAAGISQGTNSDFAVARYYPDGSLDPTFDNDGKVTTDFLGGHDGAYSVILQPDGKIVAAGFATADNGISQNFALVRYKNDGSLDTSFDGDGKVTTSFAIVGDSLDIATDVVLQSDGKILVVGWTNSQDVSNFALARYLEDGSLDPDFSSDGKQTTDFNASMDSAYAVDVQTDGKIVVAGGSNAAGSFDFAVARYDSFGNLDPTFGSGGILTTDFAGYFDNANDVLIQPDGNILATGYSDDGQEDFALARYDTYGSLDLTFGDAGKRITDIEGGDNKAYDAVLQTNGKIIVAGVAYDQFNDFALVRYYPDGTLDLDFSNDGIVITDFHINDEANAVALQSDGKILAAGVSDSDFALARYEASSVPFCVFCDDFDDGLLPEDWIIPKPEWHEALGLLIGTPMRGEAEIIATPAFAGCRICTIETSMKTMGGDGDKVSLLAWYRDEENTIEVLMNEESDKWVLKQLAGGKVVAKAKALLRIIPDILYIVNVSFDGINFRLVVNGVELINMPAAVSSEGTIGFRVKNTTGSFNYIRVN